MTRALHDVGRLRAAVVATFERRTTHAMPGRFDLPLATWERPYRRFAIALELGSSSATVFLANEWLHEPWGEVRSVE